MVTIVPSQLISSFQTVTGRMMLKPKLQHFAHLTQRFDSLEKTLMLGGIGGKRRREQQDEMAGWHH